MKTSFVFDHPDDAVHAVAERLAWVAESETDSPQTDSPESVPPKTVPLEKSRGRILAADLLADRDSPASDVSAMDGYALRLEDCGRDAIPVVGSIPAGSPPPTLPVGAALKIFTGAVVPRGADCVIRLEDVRESPSEISLRTRADALEYGANIRRRGENLAAGQIIAKRGSRITAASMATLANFGHCEIPVHRQVRVALITTGDEVVPVQSVPEAYQLRNSNRCSVGAVLDQSAAVRLQECVHVSDSLGRLRETLEAQLGTADVIVLSGGVSMGDHDVVPEAVIAAGAEIVFHRLPIRPGKPLLAAVTPEGKLVVGLPGNPVSATINARLFVQAWLRKIAGQNDWQEPPIWVDLVEAPERTLPLHFYPMVARDQAGNYHSVASKGSGDLVALGHSEGFVHIPPGEPPVGRRQLYRW
ncbi:MAG: molybdopterin molybdotransferase MoeA [Planctomycetota bacterium]